MSGVVAIEVFIAEQRGLLDRLQAFILTPSFERLRQTLRRGGAEGSEAWLAAWLIQPSLGLGQVPMDMLDLPGGLDQVDAHLLRALLNPIGS